MDVGYTRIEITDIQGQKYEPRGNFYFEMDEALFACVFCEHVVHAQGAGKAYMIPKFIQIGDNMPTEVKLKKQKYEVLI